MEKKLYIKTYGCQMNVYDSDKMRDLLEKMGFSSTDEPGEASIIIFNTCHIREKASEKLYSDLGRVRLFKEERASQGAETIIIVAGCVGQAEGGEILRRAPFVDIVVGPQTYHRLPEMIARALRVSQKGKNKGCGIVYTDFPLESKFDVLPVPSVKNKSSAYLSVQEGCDKFCSFCVVPYTRGAEYSRPVNDIIREAQALISQGVKEITLLGQNVTAYHGEAPDRKGEWSLARLMFELAELEGLKRLRYTTSHPRDMSDDLIEAHEKIAMLMPYLHLPIQSGSNAMLKRMNRQHTVDDYYQFVDKLKEARPDMALSTDLIVGHPGESEADFEETLKFVERVKFASSYSFKYSPRPGTPSAIYEDQVAPEVKDRRLQVLQALLKEQERSFNQSCVNKTLSILLEGGGRHEGQFAGRSPYMQSVYMTAHPRLLHEIVDVKIVEATAHSLRGEIVFPQEVAA